MNKLAILLCAVLLCSYTINAQLFSGLTSSNAFLLGALGAPLLGGILRNSGGLGGGIGGGFIPPPPPPFLLPPPVHAPIMVHRRRHIRYGGY